ncbi:MAG: hypothetical protein PWP64_766 [Candidatus Cloacimonadota bacterium]|nr:hypothetical protein [Candidatus Cloacimonadota bacterium]
MIRIIAGIYKKRKLYSVPGKSTRPTTNYNREMIFSCYQDFSDKRVLDLFAGTGAFGLEALSRGAAWVDFVEFANPAMGTILNNIKLLGCENQCHVYRKKVASFLKLCKDKYDIIFLDPPYDKNLINPTINSILTANLLNPEAVIIVEHSPRESLTKEHAKMVFKNKTGKTCSFSWLRANPDSSLYSNPALQ